MKSNFLYFQKIGRQFCAINLYNEKRNTHENMLHNALYEQTLWYVPEIKLNSVLYFSLSATKYDVSHCPKFQTRRLLQFRNNNDHQWIIIDPRYKKFLRQKITKNCLKVGLSHKTNLYRHLSLLIYAIKIIYI